LKKEPKNFCLFGAAQGGVKRDPVDRAQAQRFFGSFFQKRTLLLHALACVGGVLDMAQRVG
jgi:hypothetical protein